MFSHSVRGSKMQNLHTITCWTVCLGLSSVWKYSRIKVNSHSCRLCTSKQCSHIECFPNGKHIDINVWYIICCIFLINLLGMYTANFHVSLETYNLNLKMEGLRTKHRVFVGLICTMWSFICILQLLNSRVDYLMRVLKYGETTSVPLRNKIWIHSSSFQ